MGIPKLASWMASTPRCCAWGCLVLAAAITFVAAACAHDTAKTPSSGGPPCPLADRQASGPPPPLVDASTANAVATRVRRQRLLGGLAPATQTWLRDIADRWPGPGVGLNHPRCVGWNGESACGSRCIRCDATNTTVAALGLQRTALTGSIPPRMCDLPGLQLLDLSGNSLTGGIPSCIDRLTGLVDLTLEHNALSGSIPPEVCRLAGLQSLFLNSNNLTGAIPACIDRLTGLTQLELQANALAGSIPPEICSLAGLQLLFLYSNNLEGGIPACIGQLTGLVGLALQYNVLSGSIPQEVCSLAGLQSLFLNSNNLTGAIPACIDQLTGLAQLELQDNALWGSIPLELCSLAGLQLLFIYSNNLTGAIPACVGQLTSLTQLGLQDNALSGSIPPEICSLAGLQHLVLSGNSLTGGIPVCIDRLTGLVDLALENNELSGSIPPEVCSLTGLQSLSLNSNNLTGAIPACIDQLTGLTQLELQDNTLSGSIPPGICCLAGLQYLFLNSNHLTDAIPACIDQITGLVELVLADNSLSGSIPPEICSLAGLQLLALSNNKLTGGIPACVNQLISLHYMRLDANELSGNPFFQGGGICAMPRGLKQLELSDNAALTAGPVPGPGCLCDNPDLARLGLSFTSRTGPIPACFNVVNTPLLEKLALDRNPGLTGSPIPPTLCGLQRLTGLHLHGNGGLAGPLPTCLGEMTNLVQLDLLEVPGITGSLPPGLFALPNLQYLVVSGARPLGGSGFPQSPVFKCPRSDGFTWAFTLEFYGTPNCTGSPTTCETTAVAEFVNAACYVNPISVWSKSASAASSCATGAVVHAYGDFSTESACTTTTDTINTFAVGTCIPRGSQSFVLTCSAASSCPSSTSSTDPVDSSLPSSTVSASAAAAAAGGERRCPRISRAVDYIWQPPANLTNGTTLPWLPSAKLVAFVGCGLKGPIPSWLVNLPAINSIDLSGNELSGPLPTILGNTQPHVQNGIQLTQFAAADNQLTGTLAALKATLTTLTQLDVSNNHISGVVPSWLATRSAHMAVLKAKGNWLSCVLPDDLAINGSDSIDVDRHADGRGDVILDLLTNNVFDCPVPKSVKDADEAAPTYKCGSHSLWVSIVIVGMAQLLLVATMCTSRRGAATVAHVDDTGAIVAHNSDASTVSGIDLQFRRASAVVAVLFATTLIPAYVTSVSVLECRLGWAVTAAYLEGAASTAFLSSAPVWTWLLLVSGGIGGSAVIWWLLLIPALQQRGDKAGGDDEAARKPAPTTSSPPHRTACAALVALVWTCVSLAINIGFVYLEENSEALDALGLGASATVTAKKMAVFLFGILHELIEHLAAPWVVWLIVQQARGGRAGPDTLHMLATSVKLVASVGGTTSSAHIHERCLPAATCRTIVGARNRHHCRPNALRCV